MKSLRTYVLCASISICGISASAQETNVPLNEPNYNKPKLFAQLPDNISLNINSLASTLLSSPEGARINVAVSPSLNVQGVIVSTATKDDGNIQSAVVRLTNYNNATFSFSRLVDSQTGTVSYTGRIVNMAYGDLYEIKNSNGQYSLVKKTFYELINE